MELIFFIVLCVNNKNKNNFKKKYFDIFLNKKYLKKTSYTTISNIHLVRVWDCDAICFLKWIFLNTSQ